MGAVLVIGKSMYVGWNKAYKTDPKLSMEFPTIHAELDVIKKAGLFRDLSGAKLYVYRNMRNGEAGLAKPCVACEKLITKHGIKEYYYSIDSNTFGACFKTWNHSLIHGDIR